MDTLSTIANELVKVLDTFDDFNAQYWADQLDEADTEETLYEACLGARSFLLQNYPEDVADCQELFYALDTLHDTYDSQRTSLKDELQNLLDDLADLNESGSITVEDKTESTRILKDLRQFSFNTNKIEVLMLMINLRKLLAKYNG